MSNYAQISASTIVKKSQGKIKGIFCSSVSGGTITIYDSAVVSTATKVIDTFTPVAATNYNFFDGINTENGIYVVIASTASVTIYYE